LITADVLKGIDCVVFGGPKGKFTEGEFDALRTFMKSGGGIVWLVGSPDNNSNNKNGNNSSNNDDNDTSNVNYFTEEFGISIQSDSVVRTVYHKYLHPKQVYVANGVVHPEVAERKGVGGKGGKSKKSKSKAVDAPRKLTKEEIESQSGLTFVYPYGSTLAITLPSVPILTSGPISFPLNRPVCAVYEGEKVRVASTSDEDATASPERLAGRMVVVGSVEIFADDFLDKEENGNLADLLLKYVLNQDNISFQRGSGGGHEPEIDERKRVPDIEALAERLKPCLQEAEPLPQDFTQLFDDTLFRFDTSLIPEAVDLYKTLNVKVSRRAAFCSTHTYCTHHHLTSLTLFLLFFLRSTTAATTVKNFTPVVARASLFDPTLLRVPSPSLTACCVPPPHKRASSPCPRPV